ncbi:beta-galactosidase [Sandaracinobacteroides saxicola]|uniref:Beta-galactosidase n=1 Tax=Sandaracinobacteroides saxicola TaxID=2759707 RepID=A0A7G5IJ22_9SPHN|nr:beta-galactosidase [Sandaracinobacteroides saxicola]QMW23364.1 beta-galactosidase [Sandaracinobacteroides saxicola]
MRLGVCYYPEHWPEARWADDAAAMVAMGLRQVRIGEFAWSRVEPEPGVFDWGWLDRAIDTLGGAGLRVILGTPTATPPKWLVDAAPDILAWDRQGRVRGFGSRRHYCFSSQTYRQEAARITRAFAGRYGMHPHVAGWQIDNEYGCHDTTLSYSPAAREGFRRWLRFKYRDIAALNAAWGTVFWSQDYGGFGAVELPNLTVTEPNPAQVMDFRRYSSERVVRFNQVMAGIVREHSPGRDIMHNVMGFVTDFDHHALGADLDVTAWDSYPLGFLEQYWFSEAEKVRYARTGHPDIAAFHHDLYRGCSRGRWGVIEQQPGPVNWARHNPAPLPGMVRLWTLEAAAHGAEYVSYFRWRQFPQAQEAMHAGLQRVDGAEAPAAAEVRAVAAELAALGAQTVERAPVALIVDYPGLWAMEAQPQGADYRGIELLFRAYEALRRLGLDVDVVSAAANFSDYAMVVAPVLPFVDEGLVARLAAFEGQVLLGPRAGSKTADFAIPGALAPGALQALIPLKVTQVESLRRDVRHAGDGFVVERWLEHVESALAPELATDDGHGVLWRQGGVRYLSCWPDAGLWRAALVAMAGEAGVAVTTLPDGVRMRRTAERIFVFNWGPDTVDPQPFLGDDDVTKELPVAGVLIANC